MSNEKTNPFEMTKGAGTDSPELMPAQYASAESAIVAAQGRAEIEAAYMMALHRPRNLMAARVGLLEACKRKRFAEVGMYRKAVGGGNIVKQLSIRAAEEVLIQMGNIRVISQIIYEDGTQMRMRVTVTELEKGGTYSDEFTLQKVVERHKTDGRIVVGQRQTSGGKQIFLVQATEEEMYIKQGARVSRIIRNCILRIAPSDILEDMRETIEATMAKAVDEDPKKERKRVIDTFFFSHAVSPEDLAEYLGHPVDAMTGAEIVELRQVFASLHEGVRWADIMDGREGEQTKEVKDKESVEAQKPRRGRPAGAKNKPKDKETATNQNEPLKVVKEGPEAESEPKAEAAAPQVTEDHDRVLKRIANARRFKEESFQKLLKDYDLTEDNFSNIGTEVLLHLFSELAKA